MGGNLPKNYTEAIKELRKTKAEVLVAFVAGIVVGILGTLMHLVH